MQRRVQVKRAQMGYRGKEREPNVSLREHKLSVWKAGGNIGNSGECPRRRIVDSRLTWKKGSRFNRAERRQSKSQVPIGMALLRCVKAEEHFGKS